MVPPKVILPPLPIMVPESESMIDKLIENRHTWRKGRLEFMGGPVNYCQGNGVEGYEDQNREMGNLPQGVNQDPMARDLGVDVTEQ